MQLALEKLETYAAIDPATLSSANNTTEEISREQLSFSRTSSITVNTDSSRTIEVAVSDLGSVDQGQATIRGTFALWGSQ